MIADQQPYAFRPEPRQVWVYAGFWMRVLAFFVDSLLLSLCLGVVASIVEPSVTISILQPDAPSTGAEEYHISHVTYIVGMSHAAHIVPRTHWSGSGLYELLQILIPAIYFILFEISRLQATPGKLLCGMRVTDVNGDRIDFPRAAGRYFGKFLSTLLLGIGFLMVIWTRRKQGLHDILAGTCVIRHQREAVNPAQRPL